MVGKSWNGMLKVLAGTLSTKANKRGDWLKSMLNDYAALNTMFVLRLSKRKRKTN